MAGQITGDVASLSAIDRSAAETNGRALPARDYGFAAAAAVSTFFA